MEIKQIQFSYQVENIDDADELTVITRTNDLTLPEIIKECAEHFFYHWVPDVNEWPFTFKVWREGELLGRFCVNVGIEPIFDIEDLSV